MLYSLGRYDDHWSRDQENDEHARFVALQSPPTLPANPVDTAMTGEEAYLRRLAMSSTARATPPQSPSIPSPAPVFQHVDDGEEAYRRRVDMSRPPPKVETPPPFDGAAFAPPPVVPPPPSVPPTAAPSQPVADLEARIKAQRDAAAAIAARLAAIAPPAETTPAPTLEESAGSESKCVFRRIMDCYYSYIC